MLYCLMHKNEQITTAEFSASGKLERFDKEALHRHMELAPFEVRSSDTCLKTWWNERAVPISQGHAKDLLKQNGCTLPSEYLVRNLGLSLTDCYWVRPVDSDLTWEQVNPYDNDFRSRFETGKPSSGGRTALPYTPNGSLQGQIEKTWAIINGERYLIKGNLGYRSCESFNELFAAKIHQMQGYDNYTPYYLVPIKNRPYAYGCCSELFTSQSRELVSAYSVLRTGKKRNDQSYRECLIEMLRDNGMDGEQLRHDLDYLAVTDFLISEYDRHLTNLALLRDAKTLRFLRMAPIFDSGGSFYAGRAFPQSESALLRLRTNGFYSREEALMKSVRDYNCVDLTKLPSAAVLRKLYEKDPGISKDTIRQVGEVYEKKIDLCRDLQLGRNIYAKIAMSAPVPAKKEPDRVEFLDLDDILGDADKSMDEKSE